MLSRLHRDYAERGVRVVGIALDDPQRAGEFASDLAISYPILVGSIDTVLVSRQYGNRSGLLPYSVLVDTQGIIRWVYFGALDKEELQAQITDLL